MRKRSLSLIVLVVAAMMAFAGSASATTLTSPSGTTYTGEIKAESEGSTTLKSSFIGTVTCTSSKAVGKVESHGTGVTAAGNIAELTFTGCSGGEPTSPVGVARESGKRGALEVHGTSTTGNGTVTSTGAEVIIHKTLAGTCIFVTFSTDLGTLTGSNVTGTNATLDISGVVIRTNGSGFCGESATWTGSYKIWQPSTLEVHN